MTMFLHGLGIGLMACGGLGLLILAGYFAWQEAKRMAAE